MTDTKAEELTTSMRAASLSSEKQAPKLAAHPSSLPSTLSRSFTVKSVPTDAWVQVFADRVVIGLSQLDGKVGNYLLCQASTSEVNPKAIDYDVSNLLGAREDPLLVVYARRITELIIATRPPTAHFPPVVLAISLDKEKGKDMEMFRLLVDIAVKLYSDAVSGAR